MSQLEFEDYERKRLQEEIETLEHRCSDLESDLADKDNEIKRLEEKYQAFREVVEGVEENARNVLRKY